MASRTTVPTSSATPSSSQVATPPLSQPRQVQQAPQRAPQVQRARSALSTPTRQINKDKFSNHSNAILCPLIDAWAVALLSVDISISRIRVHKFADLFRGYVLPDPWIFVKSYDHNQQKTTRMLLLWAVVHHCWLAKLQEASDTATSRSMVIPPSPNHWKLFLHNLGTKLNIPFQSDPSSSSSTTPQQETARSSRQKKQAKRSDKIEDEVKTLFNFNLRADDLRRKDIHWFGDKIKSKTDDALTYTLPSDIAMSMVWEMTQVNFHLELLALERLKGQGRVGARPKRSKNVWQ